MNNEDSTKQQKNIQTLNLWLMVSVKSSKKIKWSSKTVRRCNSNLVKVNELKLIESTFKANRQVGNKGHGKMDTALGETMIHYIPGN